MSSIVAGLLRLTTMICLVAAAGTSFSTEEDSQKVNRILGPLRDLYRQPGTASVSYFVEGPWVVARIGMRFPPLDLKKDQSLVLSGMRQQRGWRHVVDRNVGRGGKVHVFHYYKRKGPHGPEELMFGAPTDNNMLLVDFRQHLSKREAAAFRKEHGSTYTEQRQLTIKLK